MTVGTGDKVRETFDDHASGAERRCFLAKGAACRDDREARRARSLASDAACLDDHAMLRAGVDQRQRIAIETLAIAAVEGVIGDDEVENFSASLT